jgi:hypothetical protein
MATTIDLCPVCNKPMEQPDIYMMALERPYINVYFHRSCYNSLGDSLMDFIKENLDKLIKIYMQK